MPETSDQSHLHKKDTRQPEQDLPPELTGPDVGAGVPESSEQKSNGEIEPIKEEVEKTEEYPVWLFELESHVGNLPIETTPKEDNPTAADMSQDDTKEASQEGMPDDLPDWLKQDSPVKQEFKQESIPEDEFPDWLKLGLEEIERSPQEKLEPAQIEGAIQPENEPAQTGLSGTEGISTEELIQEGHKTQGNEPLAEVRLALKDEEQAKAHAEHPGLLTKMTGWLHTSSQVKRESSDEPVEAGAGDTQDEAIGTPTGEDQTGSPSEISTELLASRLGESGDEEEDDAALRRLQASIFLDEFEQIPAEESETEWAYTYAEEGEPAVSSEETPIDKDLRREILSDIEPSNQGQSLQIAKADKETKGFFKGLFRSKKTTGEQSPDISDQDIERRLLLGLTGAGIAETQPEENSSPTPGEPSDQLITSSPFFLEEEAKPPFTMDEDASLEEEEDETFYPEDLEAAYEGQLEYAESLPIENELSIVEETAEGTQAESGYIEMRELALHDYEESRQRTEGSAFSIFLQKTVHQIEELSPLQKISLIVLFIMDVGFIVLLAGVLTFSNFSVTVVPPAEPPAPTAAINLPFPTQVILPGGWSFNLTPVTLQQGLWANQGAEWLQGSEITKWIALPWSKQLEAVVVTLGPDDQIEVVMSNLDHLKYRVDSVQDVPVEKVRELNRNTPSLLLILANKQADTRVVVIGSLISNSTPK